MFERTPTAFNRRLVIDIIIVLALVGAGFIFRTAIVKIIRQQYALIYPCSIPIRYSIGHIDDRFGVSKSELVDDLAQATSIWEQPLHKKLFEYASSTEDADLLVNLTFDSRQETTNTLGKINTDIENGTAQFNTLRTQYEQQLTNYNQAKAAFDAELQAYTTKKASYENDIAYWNSHGGASKQKYAQLEQTRNELNTEQAKILQDQQHINSLVTQVNQTGASLNNVIQTHNLNVRTYNAIGASTGDEFEEGVYKNSTTERSITIFQFSDQTKFIRVLAHEFGHALGLNHVNDPEAIMYKINNGKDLTLTSDDRIALKVLCGIK